ncbi:VOC family protein [Pararhodobacter zhoushanensis]|uniref:VOC family protein n=1 Tax=Pararhodobacter zhoushanensis TaxID=2479545 RepID=A0ABT3H3V7_9RHOB|nr:VOC family protein [Pararhodobacter zhoushanensis]MCW1934497.1 VOC family protein [Pararhodobacter zhoushanensis]
MPLSVTPYLVAKGAEKALAFYVQAFGAVEEFRMIDPGDGRIGHAELTIGTSRIMLSDEYPDFGAVSPDTLGGTAVTLHLATEAVDADVARAADAGAIVLRAPADQSFGERTATVMDPFGHRWILSQTVESVTPAQMQKRWEDEASA